jgi:methylglutaconyl-CoA hydratase
MHAVLSHVHHSVAYLTFNRPDKRNAISRDLIAELTSHFRALNLDDSIRVIMLTGAGSSFCAGMDLEELSASLHSTPDELWRDASTLGELFQLMYESPKITIACVNGAAVAGGAGFASVCDLALAVPTAKFGYPEVRRGLVAAMVLPHLLRHVGERTARHLLLTGELIDAREALRIGLINQVVEAEAMPQALQAIIDSVLQAGPLAIRETKRLLRTMSHQAMSVEQLARESAQPRTGPECQAGLAAFLNKQPVPWAK